METEVRKKRRRKSRRQRKRERSKQDVPVPEDKSRPIVWHLDPTLESSHPKIHHFLTSNPHDDVEEYLVPPKLVRTDLRIAEEEPEYNVVNNYW
jgi:hypothetical protein